MRGPGIPFGHPKHPFRHTTETARKAAQCNKGKTPWRAYRPGWLSQRKTKRVSDQE